MRMRYGATRFVLLVGDKAIKIGRIRPLRVFVRMLIIPFSKKRREHFFARYGPGFGHAVWNDLCVGLYANRIEDDYYQSSKDPRVMPTIGRLLGGWVIVQLRGVPVSTSELEKSSFTRERLRRRDCDLGGDHQFCRLGRKVVLVDYGARSTTDALLATTRS